MVQYRRTQCLSKAVRGDQREKRVPVIGYQQPAIQVDPVDMPDPLDVTAEQTVERISEVRPDPQFLLDGAKDLHYTL